MWYIHQTIGTNTYIQIYIHIRSHLLGLPPVVKERSLVGVGVVGTHGFPLSLLHLNTRRNSLQMKGRSLLVNLSHPSFRLRLYLEGIVLGVCREFVLPSLAVFPEDRVRRGREELDFSSSVLFLSPPVVGGHEAPYLPTVVVVTHTVRHYHGNYDENNNRHADTDANYQSATQSLM